MQTNLPDHHNFPSSAFSPFFCSNPTCPHDPLSLARSCCHTLDLMTVNIRQ